MPDATEITVRTQLILFYLLILIRQITRETFGVSLNVFLESSNLLHTLNFGFREGISSEKVLLDILTSCANSIAARNYTSLVSIDI